MWKNRLGYILFFAAVMAMLVISGKPYLLGVLIVLFLLAVAMGVFTRHDVTNLKISASAPSGAQEGKENFFTIDVFAAKKIRTAGYLMITVCEKNEMFGRTWERKLLLWLKGEKNHYKIPLACRLCGEIRLTCKEIWVRDLLKLFQVRANPFGEIRTVIYPRKVNLQVELSQDTIGAPKSEGMMQNRKGNDLSEIYDIREYVPGDDIRSIHWKLSSKTENLILREASDPSHYNVVLLPDFGQDFMKEEQSENVINAAVAVGASIGQRLIEKRVAFCMALPSVSGLQICEIKDRRELQRILALWLVCPVAPKSGDGLQCFMMERLEQYFTRLLILTAGEYRQNLSGLDERIGITVLHISAAAGYVNAESGNGCEIIEIPAGIDNQETYRIRC